MKVGRNKPHLEQLIEGTRGGETGHLQTGSKEQPPRNRDFDGYQRKRVSELPQHPPEHSGWLLAVEVLEHIKQSHHSRGKTNGASKEGFLFARRRKEPQINQMTPYPLRL